ncbi:unnamed protein product [Malus baccata var. baccata]
MPSQKRSTAEQLSDDVEHRHHQRQRPKQSRLQDEHQLLDEEEEEEEEEEEAAVEQEEDDEDDADSDGGASSTSQEIPENNECPACRAHCASRRSLRDDPKCDALIAALYPDIEKYEEEELSFHQEERTRNEQIQASIAKVFEQQSEALTKRRTSGKDISDSIPMRPRPNNQSSVLRKRNSRAAEDDNDNDNNTKGNNSSSTDDRCTELRPRQLRRRAGFGSSQPTSSLANSSGGCAENNVEGNRENRRISPGVVWSSEMLVWGRGSARSHTRRGIASGYNSKNSESTRISKLVDYLQSSEENNDELDVHLMLISLDTSCAPSLQRPHLSCRPSLSVKHLCEYVSHQTPLSVEEVELLAVKGPPSSNDEKLNLNLVSLIDDPDSVRFLTDPCRYELQILQEEQTLIRIRANCTSSRDHLVSRQALLRSLLFTICVWDKI